MKQLKGCFIPANKFTTDLYAKTYKSWGNFPIYSTCCISYHEHIEQDAPNNNKKRQQRTCRCDRSQTKASNM